MLHQSKIYTVKFWKQSLSPGCPNSFNFMQFLEEFGKIVCSRPHWRVLASTWRKSWIRHCWGTFLIHSYLLNCFYRIVLCERTLKPVEQRELNLAAWIDVHPEDEPRAHHYQHRRHVHLKGSVTLSENERERKRESKSEIFIDVAA